MICPNCGIKIPGDSEFCQYCGKKIEQTPSVLDDASSENNGCLQVNIAFSDSSSKEVNENSKDSVIEHLRRKSLSKKWLVTMICLSLLFLGLIGLNVYQYITGRDNIVKVSELTKTVDNLNSTIIEKDNQIKSKDSKIASLTNAAESFQDIIDTVEYGNLGYASSNFHSSESIIVVGENEQNRNFTLTAYWSNGGNVSVDYDWYSGRYSPSAYVNFTQDSWNTSVTMSIEPKHSGVVVVTFSNDVDSQTFDVIIIVE